MELIKIQALFLVLAPTWPESVQSFVADRVDPKWQHLVSDFTHKLQRTELPVFMDRTSVSEAFLGTLRFEQGEVFDDFAISAKAMSQLWHPKGFLLSIVLNTDDLNSLTTEQRRLIQASFGRRINDLFRRMVPRPPRYLGEIVTLTEPSLAQITDLESLRQFCQTIDIRSRDVFWGGVDHNALFLMDPNVVNAARHELIAVDKNAVASLAVEMDRLLGYAGTRSIEDLTVDEAKTEAKEALSFRAAIQAARATPSWRSLLASIHPGYRNPLDEVHQGIGVINSAIQRLAKLKTDLYGLRQSYESGPLWGDGYLTLAEFHAMRGTLIALQNDEAGTLTLTAYLRRSAQNILSFYIQRLDDSMAEIGALLSALNTMASINSAQQAEILNRLILILTVVSAQLALLQVISATTLWSGPSPTVILLVFLVIDISAVILAFQSDQRRRPR
jgi:hypothetical protein